MAGNHKGGIKARDKNLAKDPDFYKKIGAIGGSRSSEGGFGTFTVGRDGITVYARAVLAGSKGGRISRRKRHVETKQEA